MIQVWQSLQYLLLAKQLALTHRLRSLLQPLLPQLRPQRVRSRKMVSVDRLIRSGLVWGLNLATAVVTTVIVVARRIIVPAQIVMLTMARVRDPGLGVGPSMFNVGKG
jgi:hypothetical protein